MIEVKDGSRALQFDGRLIANSTSWRRGADRWVEFNLYRTDSGKYVINRIGMSLLYHAPDCEVVRRNNLRDEPASERHRDAIPCPICRPHQNGNFPIICPERPRHWAQVCETADAVVEALQKYDDNGSRYLTYVAKRLLEAASEVDNAIDAAYRIEIIN